MKKVLLAGNGFTSNLIKEYSNVQMMAKIKDSNFELFNVINRKFDLFRCLVISKDEEKDNKERIINCIKENNLWAEKPAEEIYEVYFENYGLKYELVKADLSGIEMLLKVTKLFKMTIEKELKQIANEIYFNDGNNGINSIKEGINIDKLNEFINSFNQVYTTNFDFLLDNVYKDEVFHLHGGFDYTKIKEQCGAIDIIRGAYKGKDENFEILEEPFLAWGIVGDEKLKSTKGGMTFPMSFPFRFPLSAIDIYFDKLEKSEIEEIHIWGYSGQNDKHINDKIKSNPNIKRIYYYCNPKTELHDEKYHKHIDSLFMTDGKTVALKSWEIIWKAAGV